MEIKYLVDYNNSKNLELNLNTPIIKITIDGKYIKTNGVKNNDDYSDYFFDVTEIINNKVSDPTDKIYTKGEPINKLYEYLTVASFDEGKLIEILKQPRNITNIGKIISLYPTALDPNLSLLRKYENYIERVLYDIVEVDGGYNIVKGSDYYDISNVPYDHIFKNKYGNDIVELICERFDIYKYIDKHKDLILKRKNKRKDRNKI